VRGARGLGRLVDPVPEPPVGLVPAVGLEPPDRILALPAGAWTTPAWMPNAL